MKEHDIKTYGDLLRAANVDNVECLITDLGTALRTWVGMKGIIELTNPDSLEKTIETARFTWIDDGKNDAKFNITVSSESHE